MERKGLTYKAAGVDLDAAARAKESFSTLLDSTRDARTLSALGAFGGCYAVPKGMADPVLVASADGVGTKLKVAFASGRHDSIGRDLVNHCVNDILVQGARPLFFLDYLATGALHDGVARSVVEGLAQGCRENSCVLLGGETAEMPSFYADGEYDLAGFVVGVVDRSRLLDGAAVRAGDRLIGVAAGGLHTNGYTLARTVVFERMGLSIGDDFPGEAGASVADVLLRVHRSYLDLVGPLLDEGAVSAMAHVTGGGIEGNLPRALPEGLGARIDCGSWPAPNVFRALAQGGHVDGREMYRVFNMGVGMVLIVPPERVDRVLDAAAGPAGPAWEIGEVVEGTGVAMEGAA